ncbi:uncharacterized protein LOC112042968 [Bicyclus anynana]|uniref:Uncharacterized protein LOC112042968 n=1 Tax=Bicyclus anynana TaxID=110368 RepID=A0ABM3LLP6_BICAN|nr:uncharacterized protein LOC112042968 [Bicyclus anynana]
MQIYDKISDCVYIFNKIYAPQILFMFNSWLLSTMLAICRSLSPTLRNTDTVKSDVYYYILINLRPLIVTKSSEYLTQEWEKTLTILYHILIYDDLSNYKGSKATEKTKILVNVKPHSGETHTDYSADDRHRYAVMKSKQNFVSGPEYYKQIGMLIKLVESKKLQLSTNLYPVTTRAFVSFAGRVISYSVFMIQHFYINH